MAIRDAALDRARKADNGVAERYLRKANQHWDLAGCARQDGDSEAEAQHTALAREYQQLANEASA